MKKEYHLPQIPKEEILFLDTSAFGLDDYKSIYHVVNNQNFSISFLKECTTKLERLTRKLSRMDNWTTIWGVVDEFRKGNNFFYKKLKQTRCRQKRVAFSRCLKQRVKTIKVIRDKYRIADSNSTKELFASVRSLEPRIDLILRGLEGDNKKRSTDVRLVAFAIEYSKQDPVCMYSQDRNLLKTFITASEKFSNPENSMILSDRTRVPIKIKNINIEDDKFLYETWYGKLKVV